MGKDLVVVTGASSGIGAATARRFGREGFPLALLARRLDRLEQLRKEISSSSFAYELDVRDENAVFETLAQIEKEQGPIAILINNAGLGFGLEPAYQCKLEEWDQCVDVNIKGLLYCTRAVLPDMVKRDKGHIVNLGSVAGHYPYPGGNVYGATKAFVHQFSLNLRADLLGTQVRVSCIEPGLTETEFSTVRFRGDEQHAKKVYAHTHPLHPEDIAEVIYFCTALPKHVNINAVEMMPVMQASANLAVHRF
ncbi:MAG TPA: SDR family NAD(P)-dependent oxidoreductase [Rhabdochlamydiaceae bacterium]|jgi:3-hydroxy acid dehydrogenase/malonic semialdehyde reductase